MESCDFNEIQTRKGEENGKVDDKELDTDGVTSSEDGELHLMDVTEPDAENSPSHSGGCLISENSAEDLRLAAALVADFSNHADSSSSMRGFSRNKQYLGTQKVGEGQAQGQGSAVDGMKAFWGAIHESSSSSSLNITSAILSLSSDTDPNDSSTDILAQKGIGNESRNIYQESVAESDDESEHDEAVDLWDENGEMLDDQRINSHKRFRRHTIAY